jgi:hypothetical protein
VNIANVFEAMLGAVIFAPFYWLITVGAGAGVVATGVKKGALVGVILFASLALVIWFGGTWLSARCEHCNYVDRIYHSAIRWGLLFWQAVLVIIMLGIQVARALQNRRSAKES